MGKKDVHKQTKMLVAGMMVLLLLAVGSFFGYQADKENKVSSGAVLVQTPFLSGQGVVYEKRETGIYLVTAGHVMEGMALGETCTVQFVKGQNAKAELFYLSEVADIAFLFVSSEQVPEKIYAAGKNRALFDKLKEGDKLYALDFDGNRVEKKQGRLLSPWIYLDDFSLDMMLAELPCRNGMSGCGIYDKKGHLIGILCGVSQEEEAAVLPLSVMESEWIMAAP